MQDQIGIDLNDDHDIYADEANGAYAFRCSCCERREGLDEYTLYDLDELLADLGENIDLYCDVCNADLCTEGGHYPVCTKNVRAVAAYYREEELAANEDRYMTEERW